MNAYELADLMLDVTDMETSEYYQAGVMLRQQAKRIEFLEMLVANRNEIIDKFNLSPKTDPDLANYQQQAAELWNDSCTSNRRSK